MPFRQLLHWLLVVVSVLLLAVLAGWLPVPVTAVWFRSYLFILGLVLACGGVDGVGCIRWHDVKLPSFCTIPRCEGFPGLTCLQRSACHGPAPALLLLVGTPFFRVEQLNLPASLPPEVGYAVVVNDHQPGEPVEQLAAGADCFSLIPITLVMAVP